MSDLWNSSVSKVAGIPLRPGFFRCSTLGEEERKEFTSLAEETLTSFTRMADHQRWKALPPERDGVQICKDTSNLEKSMRLVRAASVIPAKVSEITKVFSAHNTEAFRSICKRFFASEFLDGLVLQNIDVKGRKSKDSTGGKYVPSSTIMGSTKVAADLFEDAVAFIRKNSTLAKLKLTEGEKLAAFAMHQLATVGPCTTAKPTNPKILPKWEAWNELSQNHTREEARAGYVQFLTTKVPDWCTPDSNNAMDNHRNRLITLKWGAFQPGASSFVKGRDMCVLDCVEQFVDENVLETGVWCCTSIEGHKVGCMSLAESHGLQRTPVSKLGFLWRQTEQDNEVEIIFCASVSSKYAKNVSQSIVSAIEKLQILLEDLRISRRQFVMRNQWVDDKQRPGCQLCMRNFHSFRRKHHCRMCGEVICSDCSTIRAIELPVVGSSKLRLCKACLSTAKYQPLPESQDDELTSAFDVLNLNKHDDKRKPKLSSASESSTVPPQLEYQEGRPNRSSPLRLKSAGDADECSSTSSHSTTADRVELDPPVRLAAPETVNRPRMHSDILERKVVRREPEIIEERKRTSTMKNRTSKPKADKQQSFGGRRKKSSFSDIVLKNGESTESMFDLLCDLACQALVCPIACVTLKEKDKPTMMSSNGVTSDLIADELAYCTNSILHQKPVVVTDMKKYAGSSVKVSHIRFFAGIPIFNNSGAKIGSVCVADSAPRESLDRDDLYMMEKLAGLALRALEERQSESQEMPEISTSSGHNSSILHGTSPQEYQIHTEIPFNINQHQPMSVEEKMKTLLWKSYETQKQIATTQPVFRGSNYYTQ